jgi:hypothetical protein
MTDRELLELAAKAAGATWVDACWPEDLPGLMLDFGRGTTQWNPLTDDGDALRLAVRLKLVVECDGDEGVVVHDNITGSFGHAWERFDSDPLAATRRAITRAAAEIGGAMK